MQSEDDWNGKVQVRASELEMGTKIAEGKYGTVYKGKCRGQTVAIKLLHNQHLSNEKLEELRTEVEIMTRLRHPCILLFMGVCTEKNNVALVMEYVEGKSLDRIIHDPKINLTVQKELHIAKEIAKGMNWLHCLDPPIIHRDIKPPNILLNGNFDVKVCDFGLSCVKEIPKPDEELRDTAVGSPIWMAPEVLSGHLASEKSDVYAYAIVLWEILTRKSPFANVRSFDEFLDDVIDNHKRPPFPDSIDPGLRALVEACWAPNPKKRPSFAEILDRLDEALINISIKDEKGREMWKAMKNKDLMGEYYPFFVAWSYFTDQLCKVMGIKQDPTLLQNHGYNCMRIILAEDYRDLTLGADKEHMKVKCENWGKFLDTFGPLEQGKGFSMFIKLQELCEKEWFHGAITSEEAEKRLKLGVNQKDSKRKGYFLVRLSNNPNSCFTISRFNKQNAIVHQRITRDKATGNYLIQIENDIKRYVSLIELVEDLGEDLFLKVPCSENRDFGIVFVPRCEVNGYLDPTTAAAINSMIYSEGEKAGAAGTKKTVKKKDRKKEKKKKKDGDKGTKKSTKKKTKKSGEK